MTYQELIDSISEINDNPKIIKNGLCLVYYLSPIVHRKLHEDLFYKINKPTEPFKDLDEFEIEIGNILVKICKKND